MAWDIHQDEALLTTDRLYLRPHINDDWPSYRDFMQSGRTIDMGGPFSLEDSWKWFCSDVAHWALFGMGSVAIISTQSQAPIGQISLNNFPHWPEPELGWLIYEKWQGQGYVIEAATAYRDYIKANFRLKTLVSYVDETNIRSVNVAKRLGAVVDLGANTPDNDPCLVYRHW